MQSQLKRFEIVTTNQCKTFGLCIFTLISSSVYSRSSSDMILVTALPGLAEVITR